MAFIGYTAFVRPFISKWNNFKAIIIHTIIVAFVICDLAIVINPTYVYGL